MFNFKSVFNINTRNERDILFNYCDIYIDVINTHETTNRVYI